MTGPSSALAVVTGASSGIGRELARICAGQAFDLVLAADRSELDLVAQEMRNRGVKVDALQVDLATSAGVDKVIAAVGDRHVDALIANAGQGLGGPFLDQEFADVKRVIDTNITGTIDLIHRVARSMRDRGKGRILITGSIAGLVPGAYNAAYNASKAFIDSFSFAIRHELKPSGVTVTCLMPGATETEFFERAGMLDTKVGTMKKDDPAQVAQTGFDAMMRGEGDVVSGWHNKLQSAIANITPASVLAQQHAKQAAPGTAR